MCGSSLTVPSALCTPWPKKLPDLPVKIETRNYVFPGPSLRHGGSRKVVLKVSFIIFPPSLGPLTICLNTLANVLVGLRCPDFRGYLLIEVALFQPNNPV